MLPNYDKEALSIQNQGPLCKTEFRTCDPQLLTFPNHQKLSEAAPPEKENACLTA